MGMARPRQIKSFFIIEAAIGEPAVDAFDGVFGYGVGLEGTADGGDAQATRMKERDDHQAQGALVAFPGVVENRANR